MLVGKSESVAGRQLWQTPFGSDRGHQMSCHQERKEKTKEKDKAVAPALAKIGELCKSQVFKQTCFIRGWPYLGDGLRVMSVSQIAVEGLRLGEERGES